MEKNIARYIGRNRFCGTAIRLNWLLAAAAAVPSVLMLMVGFYFAAFVLYYLLLIAVTLCSFFLLLLNEKFLSLFSAGRWEDLSVFAERMFDCYIVAMPILVAASAIFSTLCVAISVRFEVFNKRGKIVSSALAFAFTAVFACIYYAGVL